MAEGELTDKLTSTVVKVCNKQIFSTFNKISFLLIYIFCQCKT